MARSESYIRDYEDTGGYEDPLDQAIRDFVATNPSPAELAAAMAQYGVSAEQIAQATNYTVEQVNTYIAPAQEIDYAAQQREDVYTPPVAAPVAPPVTVEDLYRQYAGREADPGGLAFWKAGFGDNIDANEIASFQQAVTNARAQGTEPQAVSGPIAPPVQAPPA